jgi:squalene-hopene/tetraprenyl-beta-curcumene cyclase
MVLAAMQTRPAPRPPAQQKLIDQGLAWLASLQKPDGSIHDGKARQLRDLGRDPGFVRSGRSEVEAGDREGARLPREPAVRRGRGLQRGDLYYGGVGYDTDDRPDLTNLQMALEALSASGLDPNAPTYKKALKFLQRCQNRSESNDIAIHDGDATIKSGNDGGGVYQPGNSKAGTVDLGNGVKVPRSYGSMTYALLKCMLYAGLAKDDPRLKAAVEWCQKNYTLDVNPGFDVGANAAAPYQGLFYYLHAMSQALALLGNDTIVDASGKSHAWRQEVCGRVVSMQSKIDGSWINQNSPRWMEGQSVVGYCLCAADARLGDAALARASLAVRGLRPPVPQQRAFRALRVSAHGATAFAFANDRSALELSR